VTEPPRAGGRDPAPGPAAAPRRRLAFNPDALKLVPASRREFWEKLPRQVEIDVARKFRKKWTLTETVRVILASPEETYEDVAKELGRTPGAVRYRWMAMVHLLREEHGAPERLAAYQEDPKVNHKQADYAQVHEALVNLGYYDKPVSEQFALAVPLSQPSASWRGDGTSAALAASQAEARVLRDEVRRLLSEGADGGPGQHG
jgi:hypothetical protein